MSERIWVVGIGDDGPAGLGRNALAVIDGAAALYGGARHLAFFAGHPARKVDLSARFEEAMRELETGLSGKDECRVVLASGDPLLFGVGATLARRLGPERIAVLPHPSSAQLAFARLGEPWHDAIVVSAHGRALRPALARAMASARTAILLDGENSAGAVARALLDAGMENTEAAVGERLGGPSERLTRGPLSQIAGGRFDPLAVLVLLRDRAEAARYRRSAIPDDEFAHTRGLITKAEVRALSVAALRLRPSGALWDVGAGSGSVGIEAALSMPEGEVYAVERDPQQIACVLQNRVRFRTPQVEPVEGEAPGALASLPDPDAVFAGGGGDGLPAIVEACMTRLRPGGRLVANLVALERVGPLLTQLRAWSPQVTEIAVARGATVASHGDPEGATRLHALNPVFIVAATKPEGAQ